MSEQISTPVDRASPSIPDYELVRPVGRGAYGEVWLARGLTGSFVALKIIHRAAFDHDRPFEREFEGIQRFEPISRSDPSQVAILHVGRGEGCFYYVMELADDVAAGVTGLTSKSEIRNPKSEMDQSLSISLKVGRVTGCAPQLATDPTNGAHGVTRPTNPATYQPKTLKRLLNDRGALPPHECLAIAHSLTRALAHLHGHGLVHRDVKPSNVIFVNGQAKLADIGLVTSVDATRSFVGTEGYLPPEGAGTPQADLYSLGKVLYEMSTGCDRKEFPALPPDIATRPDGRALAELNAIVVRACQLDPRERYANAEAMRADLELLQAGQSVQRRRSWDRTWSYARKLALAACALVMASAIAYWLMIEGPKQPNFVKSANPEANDEYEQGVRLLHTGGGTEEAIKHFETAIKKDPEFAEAHAHLAGAWVGFGPDAPKDVAERARSAALKAVALNPNSSFGHAVLASVKILFDLDWASAETERKLAFKLNARGANPNSEEILLESALNLACMGKTNEALAVLKQAQAGPESTSIMRLRLSGFVYEWCRQFDEAIKTYDRVIELEPKDRAWEHELQARAYLGKGDYTKAIQFGRLAALEGREDSASVKARFDALESALKENGATGFWNVQLELEKLKTDRDHRMRMAAILARLNRSVEAFEYLAKARTHTPAPFASWINMDPSFDSLRNDPTFKEMIDELWHKK